MTATEESVLRCDALPEGALAALLHRFAITPQQIAAGETIPGSWFGAPEAGIIGTTLYWRHDTPVHSALHESCHLICMDCERRAHLHTDAGGDHAEENGVNYLALLLADHLDGYSQQQLLIDMDCWGYSFRLGSAHAWFTCDASDARQWLIEQQLIDSNGQPLWCCSQRAGQHSQG
jgi:hypothetical protein